MFIQKTPQTKDLQWTNHSREKMKFYRLSESRVRRILHLPKRIEQGIAPNTTAIMQRAGTSKHPYELWVMIQDANKKRKIISVWRYPGITKHGEPLPAEILREIKNNNIIDEIKQTN